VPWHVVHGNEPMPSQLTHCDTSVSPAPITTVTLPFPLQNLHTSEKSTISVKYSDLLGGVKKENEIKIIITVFLRQE
jgi:hypothetical protein